MTEWRPIGELRYDPREPGVDLWVVPRFPHWKHRITDAWLDSGTWWADIGGERLNIEKDYGRITHWMPLPNPPDSK